MTTPADIVREARRYVGTPFVHQGRQLGRGIDCAGLVVNVAHSLGLSDYDQDGYGREPQGELLRRILDEQMVQIPLAEYAPGDVLLMRFERYPQHLAVVTDHGIVHAYESVGRCVEHRLDDKWLRRIVAAYRFPNREARD